jgi:octaprenyl-diphosphate synthase
VAAGGEANMPPQSEEVQTMLVQARADLAEKEAKLGCEAIAHLPDSPHKTALIHLAEFAVKRDF